jgi:hypothetical protein
MGGLVKRAAFISTGIILAGTLASLSFSDLAQAGEPFTGEQLAIKMPKVSKVESPKQAAEELFRKQVLESCEFKVKSVTPNVDISKPKLSLKGVEKPEIKIVFKVEIEVTNKGDLEFIANRIDLILFADNKPIPPDVTEPTATGSIPDKVKFEAKKTFSMPADMKVPPEKATMDMANIVKSDKVEFRVDGTFYFDKMGMEIPIKATLVK